VIVESLEGRLYDGLLEGRLVFEKRPGEKAWGYRGEVEATGVSLERVLGAWRPREAAVLLGKATSHVTFAGDWQRGVTSWSTVNAEGNVDVREGGFRGFPGLTDLARALGVAREESAGWGFRDLAASFRLREGRVLLPRLAWRQEGLDWSIEGSAGLDATLSLTGTVTADPRRVKLPSHVAPLAPYLAGSDGRIPVPFRVEGALTMPQISVDWEALAARAAERVRGKEALRLEEELKKKVKDPETLERLKKLLGGRGGKQ
jgi:hypothetical protein